ncbi:MAG: hypothetical protein NC078_09130, partial [Ruminococcus sp.]|nr:hypothetical protein [Ruminococcus sp.]
YYLAVKDGSVAQCYWAKDTDFSVLADDLTAALEKGEPLSHITTGGLPIGGYPAIVTECRTTGQIIKDELPYIAFDWLPLILMIILHLAIIIIKIIKKFIIKLKSKQEITVTSK